MDLAPLIHFPQARTAPPDVVRGLRAVDPTAELLYLGDGRWLLGTVRPNREIIGKALTILGRAKEAVRRFGRRLPQLDARVRLADAERQGFRPVAEYRLHGSPTSAIVHDFAWKDWMWRRTRDAEIEQLLEADREQRRAEARADLTDPARARDAWNYASHASHSVTRHDNPVRRPVAAGRVRVRTIP